jgi:Family of unknown function (DUF5691)
MLEKLINTALLGTDKMTFDENQLPESLRTILAENNEVDKETHFLRTISLVSLYEEAGRKPQRFSGEFSEEIKGENLQTASPKMSGILNEILDIQYYFRNDLLELWLEKLIENQQIVSPRVLVILLNQVESLPKKFHPKILKVIGTRGLFLLNYKTNKINEKPDDNEQIWTEGRLAERREFFINLRKENPTKALELLESTWKQESLNDKFAFLESIKNNFQQSDSIFLANILPEFAYKAKEKKTQKECRAIVTGMLLGVPETQEYTRTEEALNSYFVNEKAKGVVAWALGKEQKIIGLPETEDDFWNVNFMLANYGFEPSPDAAIFSTNQRYWLACLLEILPFEFWSNHLERDLENTLQYFVSENFTVKLEGKKKAILLNALIRNAVWFRNIDLAKALFKVTPLYEQTPLLPILSIPDKEQYLIDTKQLTNLTILETCFGDWRGTWSADFSTKILRECYASMIERNTFLPERLGAMMAQCLHPSSSNFLVNAKVYPVSATPYYTNYWEKHFVNSIIKTFEIKQKIAEG